MICGLTQKENRVRAIDPILHSRVDAVTPEHSFIIPEQTINRAANYLERLRAGASDCGIRRHCGIPIECPRCGLRNKPFNNTMQFVLMKYQAIA